MQVLIAEEARFLGKTILMGFIAYGMREHDNAIPKDRGLYKHHALQV